MYLPICQQFQNQDIFHFLKVNEIKRASQVSLVIAAFAEWVCEHTRSARCSRK